MALMELVGMRC